MDGATIAALAVLVAGGAWTYRDKLRAIVPKRAAVAECDHELDHIGTLRHMEAHYADAAPEVAKLCREHGMSNASFYKWRAKYGGMDASMVSQMKAMEDENRRLKRMYADLSMQADLLKEALGKK